MKDLITIINERLEYKNDGFYIKKQYTNNVKIGQRAGYTHKGTGYRYLTLNRTEYLEHHLVWFYFNGYFTNQIIDHIDRNITNNNITNLRLANKSQNAYNRKVGKTSKTGVTGVTLLPNGKYIARIRKNGKEYKLGRFQTLDEAISARKNAENIFCEGFSPKNL